MRAENARYKDLLKLAPIGHFTLDSQLQIVECNPAGAEFFKSSVSELLSTSFLDYVDDAEQNDFIQKFFKVTGSNVTDIQTSLYANRKAVPVKLHVSEVLSTENNKYQYHVALIDRSEHRTAEDNLRIARDGLYHVANHDPLTRLPNRSGINEKLESALKTAGDKEVALLLLDIDNFKNINNPLGHNVGDKLLRRIADRLLSSVRHIDTVGRLGGDQFAIVLTDFGDTSEVKLIAEKINSTLSAPFDLDTQDVTVEASIGISMYPVHGDNAKDLVCCADAAMGQAKSLGRNQIKLYTTALSALLTKRFELESDLRIALRYSQFKLYYQPQYNLSANKIVGYEVLLRWNHPQHGIIGPESFIEIAESTGLIEPLGEWILTEACKKLATLRKHDKDIKLSVNVSARQFANGDLLNKVNMILKHTGVPASSLELELTESALLENLDHSVEMLSELRRSGVDLAIDDFGTGYSSFSRLQQLPVSRIKIDRSFVEGIPHDKNNCCIVKAVIYVAHTMGIETVAEGVETHEQAIYLSEAGCDTLQGYYVGRPNSFDKISTKALLKTVESDPKVPMIA